MTLSVTPYDLATFLGRDDLDFDRAAVMLQLAEDLCTGVVSPLPDTAKGVILSVAGRAFTNVSSAHQMGLGSAQISFGAPNSSLGVGGLYLSRSDIVNLRRLGNSGGAFSIDPTPVDAGQGIPVWDQNVTWLTGVPILEDPR